MSAGPRGRDGVPERPSCKYPASNLNDFRFALLSNITFNFIFFASRRRLFMVNK